jgi:ATP-dependent DNA helicase RecG
MIMKNETQTIEFKQSWRDDFLKEICGFAPAQGGTLVVGVDDGDKAVGVVNAKRLMEDIPNKIVSLLGDVA